MKVSNIILLICLFLFAFACELTVATSDTSNMSQPVNLFQQRASQATCTCANCKKYTFSSFYFTTEVKCPNKCDTGYYVSAMDLLVLPKDDYHTFIIETTSTDTSVKITDFSKEQTRYNVGDCFSASGYFNLDTTDYTTKLTCKNAVTQCTVQVQNYCACSKSASKLLIIAPSLVVAGSKFTPEVRIVDSDGNVVPRNYAIELTYPGSSYTSMASNGIMKGQEITAPSSGTVKLFASISTIVGSAPSLTSAEFTATVTQSQFTCYGIAPSSSTVCSSKGTCSGQDLCTCFSGYTGSKCETSTTVTQPSSIKLSLPSSVNSGAAFTATVSMLDSSGNTLKSGSGTITLEMVGSSGITITGDKSKVASEGVASFSVQLSATAASSASLKATYQTLSDTKSINVDISRTSQAATIWTYLFTMTFGVILLVIN